MKVYLRFYSLTSSASARNRCISFFVLIASAELLFFCGEAEEAPHAPALLFRRTLSLSSALERSPVSRMGALIFPGFA